MLDAKKISDAMLDGSLKLASNTGFSIQVTKTPKPLISKNWGLEISFEELCNKALFCYRFPDDRNADMCMPHFALRKEGDRLEFVAVSNDMYGIVADCVGACPYNLLSEIEGLEITKDGLKMVLEYLAQTGASDLIVF